MGVAGLRHCDVEPKIRDWCRLGLGAVKRWRDKEKAAQRAKVFDEGLAARVVDREGGDALSKFRQTSATGKIVGRDAVPNVSNVNDDGAGDAT